MKNKTWDLVSQQQRKNIVKCGLVYKTKCTYHGVVEIQKAHFVEKDFLEKKAYVTLKTLVVFQRWTLFNFLFRLLLDLDGKHIKWMSKIILFMEILMNKSIRRDPLVFIKWRNPYMEACPLVLVRKYWSIIRQSWFQMLWIRS